MMDRKLLTSALLLPATIAFSSAALVSGIANTSSVSGTIPTAYTVSAQTFCEIPIEIELNAVDPDGAIVLYQLTEQPSLGQAEISGSTLIYTPASRTGTDRFCYTAADADGNTAEPAQIEITVRKNRSGLTYADMANNPAHYAALCLADAEIMTGETIGGCAFFRPNQTVTRSEFIAMAATLAELPIEQTSQTDFVDDGGLSAWAKPFISTAAANGLVSGYQSASGLSEIRGQNPITLAEASQVISNLLSGSSSDARYVIAAEHTSDMDWASQAVSNLTRLDILSPLTQLQDENDPITRQTACEMLYQAMQLLQA